MKSVNISQNYNRLDTQSPPTQKAVGSGAFTLFVLMLFTGVFCVAFFGPAYLGQCAHDGALAELCKAAELAFSTLNHFL